MKRRQFLSYLGNSLGLLALQSCCLFPKTKPCPGFDCQEPDLNSSLLIDSHIHLFNGTDLQIQGFISAYARGMENGEWADLIGDFCKIIETLAWNMAPNFRDEKEAIDSFENTKPSQKKSVLDHFAEKQFKSGVLALKNSVYEVEQKFKGKLSSQELKNIRLIKIEIAKIEQSTYNDLINFMKDSDEFPEEKSKILSIINFVIEFFQFRFVSAYNYMRIYNAHDTKFDLMINHVVDFDWWLNQDGSSTPTSIEEQMELSKRISIITGGLIHTFVPFDPLRQIVWDEKNQYSKQGQFNPMGLVEHSINNLGSIGVKLYPPMGFSLGQNIDFKSLWDELEFLPDQVRDIIKKGNFGRKLDHCLYRLYNFCKINRVPIIAHSSPSNFSHPKFSRVISPIRWNTAMIENKQFSNYAHFGGAGSFSNGGYLAKQFKLLMKKKSSHFADTSYFKNILLNSDDIKIMLRHLFQNSTGGENGFNQLIYGSDWKMIILEKNSSQYLKNFKEILKDMLKEEPSGISQIDIDGIMGLNAARYLGLLPSANIDTENNRDRLLKFYENNNVKLPTWYKKTEHL